MEGSVEDLSKYRFGNTLEDLEAAKSLLEEKKFRWKSIVGFRFFL